MGRASDAAGSQQTAMPGAMVICCLEGVFSEFSSVLKKRQSVAWNALHETYRALEIMYSLRTKTRDITGEGEGAAPVATACPEAGR